LRALRSTRATVGRIGLRSEKVPIDGCGNVGM
jgi:hypothetical protein